MNDERVDLFSNMYFETFGSKPQILKLAEESSELAQASIQFWYLKDGTYVGPKTPEEIENALINEIVDTEILIYQVKKIIDNLDKFEFIKNEKIKRAIQRIKIYRLENNLCPKCGSKLKEDPEDSSELYCEKCNYDWRIIEKEIPNARVYNLNEKEDYKICGRCGQPIKDKSWFIEAGLGPTHIECWNKNIKKEGQGMKGPPRSRTKKGRLRKKRSDTGKPRAKKHE